MPATHLPEDFVRRLRSAFDEAAVEQILNSMSAPKRQAYWVNPLKGDLRTMPGSPVSGAAGVYVVALEDRDVVTQSEEARDGRVYPINPSSTLAIEALSPRPGEEVLDLAAAPGGKTILMAARMDNVGRIAAVEPVKGRFFRLRANLERCGVTIAALYMHDGRSIGRKTPERFDRVLLDAPCSSEARFRADVPRSFAHWTPRKVKEAARKQRGLIRSAFACLKPGGRLVYCTCTFSREENEDVVDYLTDREAAAEVVSVQRKLPDDLWDGFFYAVIVKTPS